MGFFDLFKRKKTEPKVEEPKIEQPAVEVAEVAPCEPEPVQECVPEERVADNASQEVVAEVPAEQVVVEEPKIVEEKPQEVAVEEDDDDEPNIEEERKELEAGLEKTKEGFFGRLKRAIAGRTTVDADVLDDLEEMLITSDVGVDTTLRIIERVQERAKRDKYLGTSELRQLLVEEIVELLQENNSGDEMDFADELPTKPYVIMVVGVNGVGKTTTIGKLAYQYKQAGKKVYLGAADTFRAAAVEQLCIWGERIGVPVIKQQQGSDPASVAFDTLQSAKANDADIVLIDTAGRLHNKINLMNELTKIKNVMQKVVPKAPHDVMLVLDGSTGQNAFEQAKQFTAATQVTSLAITKLDGTAKGGVVIGISDQFKIPVRFIGLGEQMTDLQCFNRKEFVQSLLGSIAQ